jgi:hypothetical protein
MFVSNCILPLFLYCILLLLERAVLQKQEEQDKQSTASCSRQELEHNLIVQMKSVTGAGDDVCGSTLESNGYDLKTSIEAFYVQR